VAAPAGSLALALGGADDGGGRRKKKGPEP